MVTASHLFCMLTSLRFFLGVGMMLGLTTATCMPPGAIEMKVSVQSAYSVQEYNKIVTQKGALMQPLFLW